MCCQYGGLGRQDQFKENNPPRLAQPQVLGLPEVRKRGSNTINRLKIDLTAHGGVKVEPVRKIGGASKALDVRLRLFGQQPVEMFVPPSARIQLSLLGTGFKFTCIEVSRNTRDI